MKLEELRRLAEARVTKGAYTNFVVDMEPNILGTPLKVMEAAITAFRDGHKDCV